jgi:hypothetical protein
MVFRIPGRALQGLIMLTPRAPMARRVILTPGISAAWNC